MTDAGGWRVAGVETINPHTYTSSLNRDQFYWTATLELAGRVSLPCPERRGQEGRNCLPWQGRTGRAGR
jgi:hypothetical protein